MRNLLLPILLITPLAMAFAPTEPSAPAQDPAVEEPTPLQAAMGTLQGNQRKLRKLVKDPVANKAALMEALGAMEGALLIGIQHTPEPAEGMSAEENALRSVNYKRAMVSTLDTVLAMQLATLGGDAETLGTTYKALGQHKKNGHDEFQ
ncbi:MAG: hypothetical protein ACI9HE_001456 [Planctomycetota bacterium]|jgi:hypothetical protein